ncbi:MAG: 4Fe-4S dicluster domain-containing protein, partial [bacterium]|nr:4Fe-4S dicluster domain-containing protein [bacterium]
NNLSVQLAVAAMNVLLKNIGTTVDLDNPSLQSQGNEGDFKNLIEEMQAGQIGALLIEGINPAYDNPLAKEFKKALKAVPFSLSFQNYRNESSDRTTAVAPGLSYLEAWGDAQPKTNLFHLRQPLIAPLFDNRSFQDSLLRWMDSSEDYYAYLKRYWSETLFAQQSRFLFPTQFWNRSLHDGVFVLPENPSQHYEMQTPVTTLLGDLQGSAEQGRQGMVLTLYESVGMREGRHANNPWNQELPDPVTKVTWDNYAKIAPATAKGMGIRQGDILKIKGKGFVVELPAHLQPGLHPENISIALGYGREKAGKVGNGVGKDLYPWVGLAKNLFQYDGMPLEVIPTGRKAHLATTQTHGRMEGRPIIKETTLQKWLSNPASGNEDRPHLVSLWPKWKTGPENWGMVIDLNACTGCSACVISCQVENNVPVVGKDEVYRRREMHWMRIDRYWTGSEDKPEAAHQPMLCQHCADAPCETVCPVLATVHSSDGLNQQVYNRCVGTRYCANNCPYKVRRFNWFDYADNPKFDYYLNNKLGKMVLNPDVVVRSRGVMEKCSMCIQRIQAGRLKAKQEGRKLKDGEIKMACEQSCPSDAIVFGNLKDPKSRIAKLVKNERYYGVLEELGVRPNVGYLTKVRNKT